MDYENQLNDYMTKTFGGNDETPMAESTPAPVATETQAVETPVAETKVEATTPSETPTETQEESFFATPEIFKSSTPSEQPNAESKPTFELPADVAAKLKEYEDFRKSVESDEFYQAYNKVKTTPEFDFNKFVQSFAKEDFNKYSIKDLAMMDIKAQFPDLNDEEVEHEAETFLAYKGIDESSSRVVQKMFKDEMINKLNLNQKPNEYLKSLEEAANKYKPIDQSILQKEIEEVANNDMKTIVDMVNNIKGQKFNNVPIDEKLIEPIVKAYQVNPYIENDGSKYGKFNHAKFVQDQIKLATYDQVINQAIEYGKKQALKERANVDSRGGMASTPSPSQDTRNDLDILRDALMNQTI